MRQFIVATLILSATTLLGQNSSETEKIAASQGASSPLIYTTAQRDIPAIEPSKFYNEKECVTRGGLTNFFGKIAAGEDVTVAFIGGSITQGEYCYRLQTSKHLEDSYPKSHFKWINAGVSGTGTDLGSYRIDEHVLQYAPDLVFIEFAVNGGYPEAMEGMIRKIIRNYPKTDICLIYTISTGQTAAYSRGEQPLVIQKLESLADHYNISSIHLGMEAAQLEKENKLLWKGGPEQAQGRILFSADGVHPIKAGGNLYAAAIARAITKLEKSTKRSAPLALPNPLLSDEWESASMYLPSQIAVFDKNWTKTATEQLPELKNFKGWFDEFMVAQEAGASFSFMFDGDIFGLFDIGGPEVGQLKISVDGKPIELKKIAVNGIHLFDAVNQGGEKELNRFNYYCNNRYRGQYDAVKLKKGIHKVTISVSDNNADKKSILGANQQQDISANPAKYDRKVIYLGRILLRGKPLPKPVAQRINPAQQQKWEQKIARYKALDAATPPDKDVILFVGSSTVENWKTINKDFPDKPILNRGISGTKTIDLLGYCEQVVFPYAAKQIFVYEGDNDIGYKWPPEQILVQFRELFDTIRAQNPTAEIIYISIKPSPRREKSRESIEQTNALIGKFIEQQNNAGFADVYSAMRKADGSLYPEHYLEDGLHLTADGYKVWRNVIGKFIK